MVSQRELPANASMFCRFIKCLQGSVNVHRGALLLVRATVTVLLYFTLSRGFFLIKCVSERDQ